MNRQVWQPFRILLCTGSVWVIAKALFLFMPRQDEVAAMLLLLCVLGAATLADRVVAVATSLVAGLSFNYYFIFPPYSFAITSTEDAVSFATFLIVALTGSHLSIRAQLRAEESERRRNEMERLQELGSALVATDSVSEAAERATHEIARLFGGGVVLRVGPDRVFCAGEVLAGVSCVVHHISSGNILELYGAHPSMEVQNALVHLIALVLDKASAAELHARMVSAQKGEELRSTVLNALAHSFRTPLTSIKTAASMMRGSSSVPGSYSQELIEIIDEEADRLDDLIRDSLDLARIQARQAEPHPEDCHVASIVSVVLEKMRRYLVGRLVVVDIPDEVPCVRGDRFLFEQMVTQVLDNAWKYSVAGARIVISARGIEDEVVLTIRNDGIQIPDSERILVFDRFYRGTRTRSTVEGTGLGLAIAKTIAEAHGGRVWLDGDSEGPAFRFSLPVVLRELGSLESKVRQEEDYDREPNHISH